MKAGERSAVPARQGLLPMDFRDGTPALEARGVVYTKPWVVELMLDLAGYSDSANLVDALAIEPSAGEGAFLVPMALRLVDSCRRAGRPLLDCAKSLVGYEIDDAGAARARAALVSALSGVGVDRRVADELAATWVRAGDFLIEATRLNGVDFAIGNPPYVRLEDIPAGTAQLYRNTYPTMRGRADLYVAFIEAALERLGAGGVLAYICADRWMMNQYGSGLRKLIADRFGVETIVTMHRADAFAAGVDAYPAIVVIRRAAQGRVAVATLEAEPPGLGPRGFAEAIREPGPVGAGVSRTFVDPWFTGDDPWPIGSVERLALLRELERRFEPLEDGTTRVGIGVATGCDEVFITRDAGLVESSRLLPLALASDVASGRLEWSRHYLVDPWDEGGLVDLKAYPRLAAYFDRNRDVLARRHTAKKNPGGWYRTIDRVHRELRSEAKLYIHDIKDRLNPVLDVGETYPHHNLYYIQSSSWDLEALGGLLMSAVGQLFVEAYGVRMRGGYFRFQAQYLRRIRVPSPASLRASDAERLVAAFRARDRDAATRIAAEVYGLGAGEIEHAAGC